jgi:hypothetical protein
MEVRISRSPPARESDAAVVAIADSQPESQGRLAAVAISAEYKAKFLAAERRYMALAESYAFQ